jgi:Protein of unknown function (DUF3106)
MRNFSVLMIHALIAGVFNKLSFQKIQFSENQRVMNKIFLSLVLVFAPFYGQVNAQENPPIAQPSYLAMGDIGSIKTSLTDGGEAQAKTWAELSAEQRKVLAPLGSEWDTLRPWQREKMLDIASDYPKMDAQKQQRVQKRLNSWSRMTPYERENARKRYQQFYALSPEKKDEVRKKWADYQKLSEVERQKLRKDSPELEYSPDLE